MWPYKAGAPLGGKNQSPNTNFRATLHNQALECTVPVSPGKLSQLMEVKSTEWGCGERRRNL